MTPMVTVSIVTGRDPEDLRRALRSLPGASVRTSVRVTVIDNCAGFDSATAGARAGIAVDLLRNDRVRGFGDNHNQVLSRLTTPYALVMNDDVELAGGCVDRMVDFMERTSDAGAAGCRLHGGSWSRPATEGGGRVEGAVSPALKLLAAMAAHRMGAPVVPEDLARWRDQGAPAEKESLPLDYISGACCLLRGEAVSVIGAFDARFYMYLEDVDLGRRLRAGGWRCYQVAGARALHRARRSWSARTPRWMWESARHYAEKYGEGTTQRAVRLLRGFAGPGC